MYIYFCIYLLFLSFTLSDAFFHLSDKPIFLCYKVCPLYCSPRRSDEDGSSLIYLEDDPYSFPPHPDVWIEDESDMDSVDEGHPHYPYHHSHWSCKPKKTTTTEKPTTMSTTTEEPTWICMVCKKKCNYPAS